MTTYTYANMSTETTESIAVVWPATLLIREGAAGGFGAAVPTDPAAVYIEVQDSDGNFQRYQSLKFTAATLTPLDLPNMTVRVVSENMTNVTVELHDSEEAA